MTHKEKLMNVFKEIGINFEETREYPLSLGGGDKVIRVPSRLDAEDYLPEHIIDFVLNNDDSFKEINAVLGNQDEKEYEDELEDEDELENKGGISSSKIVSTCVYLLTEAKWMKKNNAPIWILSGFDKDTNPNKNHIQIEDLGGSWYEITTTYGPQGQEGEQMTLMDADLKYAKETAIEIACDLAGYRELFL